MDKVELAQVELLREARKVNNQICRLHTENGDFIKARRGYSIPTETRELYLSACDELLKDGRLRLVLRNHALDLFELVGTQIIKDWVEAKQVLLDAVKENGMVYKIHSSDGEFVQCGSAFNSNEEERIFFLEALYELVHHGFLEVVADSREFTQYQLRTKQPFSPYACADFPQSLPS